MAHSRHVRILTNRCFEDGKENANHIETFNILDSRSRNRHNAPSYHAAREPFRCGKPLQKVRIRYLANEMCDCICRRHVGEIALSKVQFLLYAHQGCVLD